MAASGTPPIQRRRIVLVALHFSEYAYLCAQALGLRYEVLLILDSAAAIGELGRLPAETSGLRIKFIDRAQTLPGLWKNLRDVSDFIHAFGPELIHFQEVATPLGVLLALRHRRLPMVLTVHDPRPHSGDDHYSLSQIRQRSTLALFRRLSDAAITHGELLREQLEADNPRLRGRVSSVPHGPLGGPLATQPSEPGNFLFFGRVHRYKGLGYFVEAIEQLHASGHKVKGVIAGRGPDLEPYRARIQGHPAFDLHERFIRDDELPGFFGRAHAVVLPYTDGTQSGVAAMALGYGRAVVSTRVGSVQEMVRDGDNGILVPPCDAKALTDALRRIVQEPATAHAMGERSYALGQGELSWARNAEISGQAYSQAIAQRGRA